MDHSVFVKLRMGMSTEKRMIILKCIFGRDLLYLLHDWGGAMDRIR